MDFNRINGNYNPYSHPYSRVEPNRKIDTNIKKDENRDKHRNKDADQLVIEWKENLRNNRNRNR